MSLLEITIGNGNCGFFIDRSADSEDDEEDEIYADESSEDEVPPPSQR